MSTRVVIVLDIDADNAEAFDAVDSVLDAGTLQDAIAELLGRNDDEDDEDEDGDDYDSPVSRATTHGSDVLRKDFES